MWRVWYFGNPQQGVGIAENRERAPCVVWLDSEGGGAIARMRAVAPLTIPRTIRWPEAPKFRPRIRSSLAITK